MIRESTSTILILAFEGILLFIINHRMRKMCLKASMLSLWNNTKYLTKESLT
jgi:hypothetical protein